ncbi:alpha/beta fold hydrolase [Thermocrispum municipale]|uniref:alpha/beta fold hydrolase n=1 Tax=Thermocrispum municipale TaxID=37926 RepID=UPI0004133304
MSLVEPRRQRSYATGAERVDRFTTADGTQLLVRTSGPSDARVTVVLVHGWTQHSGCWDGVCALLPTDVRVVRMDLRGHGGSDPARRGARTLEQLADDLAELLAARTTGPLVLVGHSMGGMTLMALAERHPYVVSARVAGMAFVATSSGNMHRISLGLRGALGRSVPRVEPVLRGLLERRENGSLPAVPQVLSPVVRWLVFGRRAPRRHVVETARAALAAHPATIGGLLDAIFAHDRTVALSVLRDIPTLVLAGDRDRLCSVEHAKVIAEQLPGTSYVLYPGAGHMLMHERTTDVARRLTSLIRTAVPAG